MSSLPGRRGMSLIAATGLTVRHGQAVVLDRVDVTIRKGEIVTVVGPNGSGKSTLIRALIGLEPAAEGRVLRQAGLRIGYVPQRLHIDAALPMTVRRFLSLPVRVSDAEFQRVLLARALLSRPDILILDEPTQGLDQPGVAGFYRLIEEIRGETGAAILMVSHDLHVVMRASDRVICLNGHICCEGAPEVVSAAPEYRALFGLGTQGTMALYRHVHDHDHAHAHEHTHVHAEGEDEHA
jgi:zinc transport system ATP-binding protein